jgi:hypothetical protein
MAYPVYDATYAANVDVVRRWLARAVPNVHPVGRNGMHRYNNQDHSMVTAMLTVENIVDGAGHDVWAVKRGAGLPRRGPVPDRRHRSRRAHRTRGVLITPPATSPRAHRRAA